jgi:phage virion morphogenesis protein
VSDWRIDVDTSPVDALLSQLARKLADLSGPMDAIGLLVTESVRDNFKRGAGPDGAAWKKSRRAVEQNGQTLVDTGRLRSSITHQAGEDCVVIGTTLPYAAVHQFGGRTAPRVIRAKNGKALVFTIGGRTIFRRAVNHPGSIIPARPFLGVRDEDWPEIEAILQSYLEG